MAKGVCQIKSVLVEPVWPGRPHPRLLWGISAARRRRSGRPLCARSCHSATTWRTRQFDPKRTFPLAQRSMVTRRSATKGRVLQRRAQDLGPDRRRPWRPRPWRASDARTQIGEAAAAGDDGVEFGELLVAAVIAAFGDEHARRVELFARFLYEPITSAASGRVGVGGGAPQRRGRSAARRLRAEPARAARGLGRNRKDKAASAPARRFPGPRRGRAMRYPSRRWRSGGRRGPARRAATQTRSPEARRSSTAP